MMSRVDKITIRKKLYQAIIRMAKKQGVSYRTARRYFDDDKIP